MKKLLLILLSLITMSVILAQNIDDMIFTTESDSLDNDIIKINYEKKDARKAMLFSAILPGAGQFYADKSALTAYLFPVLEAAMIGGIIYFNHQGDAKTEDFEYYANGEEITQTFNYVVDGNSYSYTYTGKRYSRNFQDAVQTIMMNVNAYDIYDGSFFRLDSTNSQHFYEDIGKYNKYIFGWADWYYRFATDPTSSSGEFVLDDYPEAWVWSGSIDPQLIYKRRWEQNYTIEDVMNAAYNNPISPGTADASPMRQEYIDMRNAANKQYSIGRIFTLGLAFNHIAAAVDAIILTSKVNRNSLTRNDVKLYYYADLNNNRITPRVGLSYHF